MESKVAKFDRCVFSFSLMLAWGLIMEKGGKYHTAKITLPQPDNNVPSQMIAPATLMAYEYQLVDLEKPVPAESKLNQILQAMRNYPTFFGPADFAGLKAYFDIYQQVGGKFNIDWKLLWIIHDQETAYSTNPKTNTTHLLRDFNRSGNVVLQNSLFGAMQRDVVIYPDSLAEQALLGLEHLRKIPTRYPQDLREIAFAGWKLKRDLDHAKGNLLSALTAYSNPYQAQKRWQLYNFYRQTLP